MRQKKSASILRKFLLFNLGVFSVLGLLTIVYLGAIQPNLVKKRAADHYIIINNTAKSKSTPPTKMKHGLIGCGGGVVLPVQCSAAAAFKLNAVRQLHSLGVSVANPSVS